MSIKVKVEGLKELDAALAALGKSMGKAVLRRVGERALEAFDAAWRAKAPKLTGSLAESGGIGTKLTRRQAAMNRRRDDRSSVEIFAGPNDPAAVPQEFGTVDQGAQPFVRPAWDATKGEALEVVKLDLGDEIARTAARLARKARRAAGG